ncbi:MAG TPA: hypothetical protein PK875_00800 [Spirochaetota bacterium]|nr:hypothetical protein [Spirochaetota bacterium]
MIKRIKKILLAIVVVVLLIGICALALINYVAREFYMEDMITGWYQPVIQKIYDFKAKHKEFPNSIDEYLKEVGPIDVKDVKIYEVRYNKNDANLELSIKCGYNGKKYEYIYQYPGNLTEEQKNRIKKHAHRWVILRGEPVK